METITLNYAGTGPVHGVKAIDLNGVSRTCQYDANGNMVTSPDFTNGANPLNRAITYDADNMPTRIVHANGATVDFVYDGVGKRTKKLVASGKTVLYLGDHFEVENGVNIKYIFGGNLRLAQIKGSLTSYFHKDHLGSTSVMTDNSGTVVETAQYEPFGSTRTQEGTAVSAYKFTDQELDNETNLYNYDARLYDPVLGMFVTPDSIVPNMFDPQMFNRYSYVRNNPLIYTDPTGHVIDVGTDKDGHEVTTHDGVNCSNSNSGKSADPDHVRSDNRGVTLDKLINQNNIAPPGPSPTSSQKKAENDKKRQEDLFTRHNKIEDYDKKQAEKFGKKFQDCMFPILVDVPPSYVVGKLTNTSGVVPAEFAADCLSCAALAAAEMAIENQREMEKNIESDYQ